MVCDLGEINIATAWKLGEIEAIQLLHLPNDYFTSLKDSGVTMLRPNKRLVGVNVDTERVEESASVPDGVLETRDIDDIQEIEENIASLEIEEMICEEDTSAAKISSNVGSVVG